MGRHSADERGSRVAKADGSDQYHGQHRDEDRKTQGGLSASERTGWGSTREGHTDPAGYNGFDRS